MGRDHVQGLLNTVPTGPGPQDIYQNSFQIGECAFNLPSHGISILLLPFIPSDLEDSCHLFASGDASVLSYPHMSTGPVGFRHLTAVYVYAHPGTHSRIGIPILLGIVCRICQQTAHVMACGHDEIHQFPGTGIISDGFVRDNECKDPVCIDIDSNMQFHPSCQLLQIPSVSHPSAVFVQGKTGGIQCHCDLMMFRTDVSCAEGQETSVRTYVQIKRCATIIELCETYLPKSLRLKEIIHYTQHQPVTYVQQSSQKHDPCDQRITEHERISKFSVIHPSDIIGICQVPIEIEQFPSEFLHHSSVQTIHRMLLNTFN